MRFKFLILGFIFIVLVSGCVAPVKKLSENRTSVDKISPSPTAQRMEYPSPLPKGALDELSGVEDEINRLYNQKLLIGPDHYKQLKERLDLFQSQGTDITKISELRKKLETLIPKQGKNGTQSISSDKLSFLESEINELISKKSLVAPEHYNRMLSDLDTLASQDADRVRVSELRKKLETLDPKRPSDQPETSSSAQSSGLPAPSGTSSSKPQFKNIGINIDYYNPSTGYAGDFYFATESIPDNRIFLPYGFSVQGTSGEKVLPHPDYNLPLGTNIISPVDGDVRVVKKNDNFDDYYVHIVQTGTEAWILEFDHITDLAVKEGDKVTAGQKIGKVAQRPGYNFGKVELMFFKGGNPPVSYCPFDFLAEEIKDDIHKKLVALADKWEEFKGDSNLYNQESWVTAGCLFEKMEEK